MSKKEKKERKEQQKALGGVVREFVVEELENTRLSLKLWKRLINDLIEKHGEHAIMYTELREVKFRLSKKS
jgi:hypothetical protein